MKAMGIDFGLARIGIALSDDTKFLASPFVTYNRKCEELDIAYFTNLIKEKNVDEIVCGLPYNMQGEEQEIAIKTREFMQKIEQQTGLVVNFVDERLSSSIAEDILKDSNTKMIFLVKYCHLYLIRKSFGILQSNILTVQCPKDFRRRF